MQVLLYSQISSFTVNQFYPADHLAVLECINAISANSARNLKALISTTPPQPPFHTKALIVVLGICRVCGGV